MNTINNSDTLYSLARSLKETSGGGGITPTRKY